MTVRHLSAAVLALLVAVGVGSCADDDVPGQALLNIAVENSRVGFGEDYWIEIFSIAGTWERVGLIFGYLDDYEECTEVIAALKELNPGREYRCSRAN